MAAMKAAALSGELIDLRQARADRLKRQSVVSIEETRSEPDEQITGGLRARITHLGAPLTPTELETELSQINRRLHKVSDRIGRLRTSPGYPDNGSDALQAPIDIASIENVIAQLAQKIDSSLACEAALTQTGNSKPEIPEARRHEPAMTARTAQIEDAVDDRARQVHFSQWFLQVTLIQKTCMQRLEKGDLARDRVDLDWGEQLPREPNDNTAARIAADQRVEETALRIEAMHTVAAEEEKFALDQHVEEPGLSIEATHTVAAEEENFALDQHIEETGLSIEATHTVATEETKFAFDQRIEETGLPIEAMHTVAAEEEKFALDQHVEEPGLSIEATHTVVTEEKKVTLHVTHNFSRATIDVEFGAGDALFKRKLWDGQELRAVQQFQFSFDQAACRTIEPAISEIRSGQRRKLAGDGLWVGAAAKAPVYGRTHAYDKDFSFPHLKRTVACWLFGTILVFGGYFAGRSSIAESTVSSRNILQQGVRSVSLYGETKPNAESGRAEHKIGLIHAKPAGSGVPSLIRAAYKTRSSVQGTGVSRSTERGETQKSTNLDSLAQTTAENLGAPQAYDSAARPPAPNQAADAPAPHSVILKPQGSPIAEPNISDGAVQERAMQGDAAAQYKLGNRLLKAKDLRQGLSVAAHWLEKSANQGRPGATPTWDHIRKRLGC